MTVEDLKEKVLKNFYNEHPQGKQLLDLDINKILESYEETIEDLETYASSMEDRYEGAIEDLERTEKLLDESDRENDKLKDEKENNE